MKEKIINQKGITLVALIITIIVLLILAVVAIRAVSEDGIIGHAKNARDAYNQAQITENGTLQNYTDYITGQIGDNGENNNVKKISFTLSTGMGETYYAEEEMTWKEWAQSSYYNNKFTVNELVYFSNPPAIPGAYLEVEGRQIQATEKIIDGYEYSTTEHTGRSRLKENFNCKFCIIGII